MRDWWRYQKDHGRGFSNYRHQEELINWQTGLHHDLDEYDRDEERDPKSCKDDNDHDDFNDTYEKVKFWVDASIPEPRHPRPAPLELPNIEAPEPGLFAIMVGAGVVLLMILLAPVGM